MGGEEFIWGLLGGTWVPVCGLLRGLAGVCLDPLGNH